MKDVVESEPLCSCAQGELTLVEGLIVSLPTARLSRLKLFLS